MSNDDTQGSNGQPGNNGNGREPADASAQGTTGSVLHGQGVPGGRNLAGGPTPAAHDPFDPARYRLSADYGANLGVKKVITAVACRKPNRHEFVRTRPGEGWSFQTLLFEDKENRESFLVEPDVANDLAGELAPVCLYLAVNRQNDPFLWPVKLPGPDGRSNQWYDSLLQAAGLAQRKWVRVAANMAAGHYDVWEATGDLPDPQWPEMTLGQLLGICFRDRIIRDAGHVALRKLRGEL